MRIAKSKISVQGKISVPVAVRRKLGLSHGMTIAWLEQDDVIIVRRVGEHSFTDVHQVLFGEFILPKSITKFSTKDGIKKQLLFKRKR